MIVVIKRKNSGGDVMTKRKQTPMQKGRIMKGRCQTPDMKQRTKLAARRRNA